MSLFLHSLVDVAHTGKGGGSIEAQETYVDLTSKVRELEKQNSQLREKVNFVIFLLQDFVFMIVCKMSSIHC